MTTEVDAQRGGGTRRAGRRLPGVQGIWVFVVADMTVFGILFICFMSDRRSHLDLFEDSRHALNPDFGGVNTLILLTSSWLVVAAITALRHGRTHGAPRFFALAVVCGLAFTVSKVIEYTTKLDAGISPVSNDFFMYYFVLTGMHLLHVLAGTVVLVVLWWRSRTAARAVHHGAESGGVSVYESGATFWHMVDLLWVFLFALLYLVR